jgi:hypothetical protein
MASETGEGSFEEDFTDESSAVKSYAAFRLSPCQEID